jgi:pimeloyl-ACP methyl ester carboxylesterase
MKVSNLSVHLIAKYPKGEAGGSPAVVLVHGGQALAYIWRRQLEPLTGASYRAIAPDLPGSGCSDQAVFSIDRPMGFRCATAYRRKYVGKV